MLSDDVWRSLNGCKQPRETAIPIGRLLDASRPDSPIWSAARLGEMWAVVRATIGPPWCGRCRRLSFRDGLLTIGVDDPGLVYVLRGRYLFLLREAFGRGLAQAGVREIRFVAVDG